MRRIVGAVLALLAVGACGGDGGNGPGNANVKGLWVVTFTSQIGSSCSVGQISLTLLADGASPNEGSYTGYVVDCAGQSQINETANPIVAYQVNGDDVSIQFTNSPNRFLTAAVNGATMTGTFNWNSTTQGASYAIVGTFTAAKQ